MDKKLCRFCNTERSAAEFYTSKNLARRGICRSCHRARNAAHDHENRDAAHQRHDRWFKKRVKKGRPVVLSTERANVRKLLTGARKRAEKNGLEFDLRPEDVVIPERCPVFDILLSPGKGSAHDASPTLDRIDPTRGYVRGNVAVISNKANRMKQDNTIETLDRIRAWMASALGDEHAVQDHSFDFEPLRALRANAIAIEASRLRRKRECACGALLSDGNVTGRCLACFRVSQRG